MGVRLATDLIEKARAGDRGAFAALLAQHYEMIHATAWKWTGNAADADDVAQDVCVRLASAIRGFRGDSRFSTWLYTLTLNAVRDRARKNSAERRKLAAYAVEPAGVGEDEAPLDALWEEVRSLPARQRDCVMLVHSEGLSHAETAEVLGCSEATVSWHLHEARKHLKAHFSRKEVRDDR